MACSPSHLSPLTLLLFLLATVAAVTGFELGPPTNTHLHFYFHERFLGPNATTAKVVSLHKIDRSSGLSYFGDIEVFDIDLREGSDPSSKLIGKAQGVGIFPDMANQQALFPVYKMVFSAGEYNGSTLMLIGLHQDNAVSERSIVGGTGRFRMSWGYALGKTVQYSAAKMTLEMDIYVVHYEPAQLRARLNN